MAAQVNAMQRRQDNSFGKALTIGGAVVGGVYGGPSGAIAGAGAGQMAGGVLTPDKAPPPQPIQTADTSMSRRVQSDDTLKQLRDAQTAVAQLPPEQQDMYAPPINQAYSMEAKRRGIA